MTLCVYALTGSAVRVSVAGMSGERLRLVREGPLAAIVGEQRRVPPPSHDSLRRYDRTMRALATRVPAILPARFGTCFDDGDELRFVLRSRRASLVRALGHVRNRVQMTVRMVARPGPPGVERLPERTGRPPESGTAYLRARAAHAARERDVPAFEPVRDAVQRWVRDERVETQRSVTTIYHLVPRASAEAYRRASERAAVAANLQIVVSGPWPVYAFADGWSA